MKKYLLCLISILMALCVTAGCGREKKADGPKVLKVGTEVTFPPFEFREQGSKEITGFDMDLIRAIGKKLDMQVEILDMDFEALIPAVKRGNLNLVIAGMTITKDRQKIVDMSEPYYTSGLVLVVGKGNTAIQKPEDLKGKAVAVQIGTTGEVKAKQLTGEKVRGFKTNEEVFNALKEKTVEALIIDKPVAQYFINKHHPDVVIVGNTFETETYGIVMRRHGELTPKINKALAELKNSGEYDRIYEKWFGKDSK
ncbi:basic amino acid ABC transporter substrate-binding protein [Succiniclasticum ruminis]|uniref:Amino acid ABC transporter substrate-binding protein, PAAT family n=1 Tax=Succiniclasticum ruminis DSM 9236 TaxID=1123323 RepID=A0A1I1Z2N9_9FIRM|nr:basic amino acid ABC transporter substrate-binding protein [Succiniclasticum ruminis]SFE24713.1 amino acid ABC transporter substrate-binding protein, PAAT family [Succiniclasticum ruminis DSM 9236]